MPSRASPDKGFVQRVARRIARARRAKGITQEDFAHAVGTAPRAYQRIESGEQNLTLRTIARIAAVLELSPEALITGDEVPEPAPPKRSPT